MLKFTTKACIGLGGAGIALLAGASPAFAATSFISPSSSPFTPAVDSSGNPLPQDVTTTGFGTGNIFIEVCDGRSPAAQGWDPTLDCDPATSPAAAVSTGASTQEQFTNANGNPIGLFRGQSPQGLFNCLAPEDTTSGTDPFGGNAKPKGATTANGDTIAAGVPSWTNCYVRVSSNNGATTSDQVFEQYALPNTVNAGPPPSTPEVPIAVILPVGAGLLFMAGFAINRRRRSDAA